jgi:hypothetical protein
MNRNIVEGNRKQFKVKIKAGRDKPTDDHLDVITGKLQETSPRGDCLMKEEIPSRRVMLRGAMAIGFGLLVPSVFLGCDSKKSAESTSSAPGSSPVPSADSAAPTTAKKLSQASVQYQTQPKGEQKCATCINFIAESNTCKLVEGEISPSGWCTLWAKKT